MEKQQIRELAARFSTPAYVFDIGVLKKRIGFLRDRLPKEVSLCYAVKANPFLVKEINGRVERFEVCSPGEAAICQRLGIPMEQTVVSGVYKTPSVIEELMRRTGGSGIYTVESMEQFRLLTRTAARLGVRVRLLLRLTSGNQFGLDEEAVRELVSRRDMDSCAEILGLQYYSGTQKQSLKRLKRELSSLDRFMQSLSEEIGFETGELEFGPGFPVCYFGEAFDEEEFLAEFSSMLEQMQYRTRVTLELGRSIAANCGTYLTRVVDTKVNREQRYAIVDGGIHQLVYYGQMMAMKRPQYQFLPAEEEGERQEWNVCGSLCTVNDILVKQLPVRGLGPGGLFAFENTGAYCVTEGISLFLSRELPGVILLEENGEAVQVRDAAATDRWNTPRYIEKEGEG